MLRLLLVFLLLCVPAWAQLDWGPEGFEGGAPCGLEQTWVNTPATITSATPGMTGDCWLDANNAIWDVENGLNASEMHWQFDLRASDSGGFEFFMRAFRADRSARCEFLINSSNQVIVQNSGGTQVTTSYTMTVDQIYTVETRAKQGTGANAECQIRLDGGTWEGSTNGTWTEAIDGWFMRGDGEVDFGIDNISRCAAGAVGDGACDEATATPSTEATTLFRFFPRGKKGNYQIQSISYPDAEEEAAYTGPEPIPVRGKTPYTWSVAETLPSGLSISSSTGVISGTPAAASAGTYPFTLQATDARGGFAFRNTSITVLDSGGGSLSFYEDCEDGDLTATPAWVAAGGSSCSANGFMEGDDEITKTALTDSVAVDNINAPEVFGGFDVYRNGAGAPTTDRYKMLIGLGSSDEELFYFGCENDWDCFFFTPGQTTFSGRGFYAQDPASPGGGALRVDGSMYVEYNYAAGTGANAKLRVRVNGGTLQEFNAGTATANVDRVILREHNDNATQDFFYDRFEIKDDAFPGRGPLPPPGGGGDPPPEGQPWIYSFAPERIHYVDDGACGGAGTIGDPDCWEDAFDPTHYQCGDLHLFRADTYREGDNSAITLSKNCTQENPAVFKGYVDPATGQPERVRFVSRFSFTGNWTWFVGMEFTDETSTTRRNILNLSCDGCMLINNVVYENRYTDNMNVWTAAQNVVYGNISYRPSPLQTVNPRGHNLYTQNDFAADGWKYIIQNIFMEQAVTGSQLTNMNTSGGEIDGFHIQDNLYAEHNGWLAVNHVGNPGTVSRIKIHRNYHSNVCSGSSRHLQVNPQPTQFEITDGYFAKSGISIEGYWGTTRPSTPGNVFTGNEVYDPCGSDHIKIIKTGNTRPVDGVSKLHDGDVWNNNTYGGTFRVENLQCNGGSSSNLTLAQWRTNTNNCRVTPGGAGFDLNSTEVANPTANKIVVLKNEWQCPSCTFNDMARGNIYIINWANSATQQVDISSVVGPSKQYTVRYARDFFGTAADSGTCPGSGACNVALPIKRDSSGGTIFTGAYVITGQP